MILDNPESRLRLLEEAIQQANESVLITTADLDLPGPTIVFVNEAFTRMTGYQVGEAMGQTPRMLQGARTDREILRRLRRTLGRGEGFFGETYNYRKDGSEYLLQWHIAPVRDAASEITHFVSIQRDITEERSAAVEYARAQAELVRVQAEALAELSTPLIRVGSQIVLMPLIGTLDARRAEQMLETLLQGVRQHDARIAIIDVTGVRIVDTYVAGVLVQAANAIGLLGAEAVLTGIRASVAQVLVQLGINFDSLVTRRDVASGIAYALSRMP